MALRVLVHALLLGHFPSLFSKTGSHYVAEAGLKFPECWDHRCGPPHSSKKSLLRWPSHLPQIQFWRHVTCHTASLQRFPSYCLLHSLPDIPPHEICDKEIHFIRQDAFPGKVFLSCIIQIPLDPADWVVGKASNSSHKIQVVGLALLLPGPLLYPLLPFLRQELTM